MGPLTVAATAEPDRGEAPLTVDFSAEVYEGDEAREAKFEWDFGDGSSRARGAKVTHTYTKPGSYKARVLATDAYERRGEDEVIIDVE
jgi:PKD repeat protein